MNKHSNNKKDDNEQESQPTGPQRQPDPCPPHTLGTSGMWEGRCTKCGKKP